MANFNNFNGSVIQGPERSKRKALFVFEFWNNPSSLHVPPETLIKDFQNKWPGRTLESFTAILDVEVSEEQRQRALQSCGVTLISPNCVKGTDPSRDRPNRDWLYYHEIYYPNLKETTGDVHYVVGCDPLTAKESARIHQCLFPGAELHLIPHPQGVLFVFTSLKGEVGLTQCHRTLISQFCRRKGLTGKLKVYSTILNVDISDREKKYAKNFGVTLIRAQRKHLEDPDEDPVKEQWLFHHEIYYPDLKQLPNIKYVVGYLPKTGKAAADIKARLFPDAQLFLINHKYPDDPYQVITTENRQKLRRQMLRMASNADAVFSLGPKMYVFFENAYRAPQGQKELSRMAHLELLPRPDSRFFENTVTLPNAVEQHEIITYGKIDVDTLKKSKTIVVAIGETGNLHKVNYKTPPTWKVVGISPANEQAVHDFLVEAMQCAHITPTPYRDCSLKELIEYLQQSHLCVITPSSGDYGFEGLEALAIGLPTLMPENSEVAGLIMKYFKNHVDTCIVDLQKWSEKIMRTLSDAHAQTAFDHAKNLKDEYYKSKHVQGSYERFAALFPVQCETSTSLPVTVSLETGNETDGSTDGRIAIERCFNEKTASIARADIEERARSAIGEGVSVTALRDGSLVVIMSFISLIYLHRLKGVCISGYLAEILEPELITDEMRKLAVKFGIKLQLQATYDEERFHQVESFFLKRDGGGDQLEQLADDFYEESTDEEVECVMTPSSDEEDENQNNMTAVNKSVDPFPRDRISFDSEAKERLQANLQSCIIIDGDGLNPRESTSEDATVELEDTCETPLNKVGKAEQPMLPVQPVQPVQPVLPMIRTDVGVTASNLKVQPADKAQHFAKITYGTAVEQEVEIPVDLEETVDGLAKKINSRIHRFPLIPDDQRLVQRKHAELHIYERNSSTYSGTYLAGRTQLSTLNYEMLGFNIKMSQSNREMLRNDIWENSCGQNIALFGYEASGKSSLINIFHKVMTDKYVEWALQFPKNTSARKGTRVYAHHPFRYKGNKRFSFNEVPGCSLRNADHKRLSKLCGRVLKGKAGRNERIQTNLTSRFRRSRRDDKIHGIIYVHDFTKDIREGGIQTILASKRVKYRSGIPLFIVFTHMDQTCHEDVQRKVESLCSEGGIDETNILRVENYNQLVDSDDGNWDVERDVEILSFLQKIITSTKMCKQSMEDQKSKARNERLDISG